MGTLDNKPSSLFWTTLGQTLEAQAKEAAKCGWTKARSG